MPNSLLRRPAVIVAAVVVVVGLIVAGVLAARTTVSVPSPPQSVHAVAGDGRVDVSWSAPLNEGNATITSYTASASPGGASCSTASTSCTVTSLTNGTTYTFRVTATNSAGTSAASVASNAVTPHFGACVAFSDLASRPITPTVLAAITRYYTASHLAPVTIVNNREMILTIADQTIGIHHCSNPDGSVASYVGMVPANASAAVMVEVRHQPYPVTGGSISFVTLANTATGWRVVNEGTGP